MNLIFTPQRREDLYKTYISKAAEELSPNIRYSDVISPGEKIAFICSAGFNRWQDLLCKYYSSPNSVKIGQPLEATISNQAHMHKKGWESANDFLSSGQCKQLSKYFESNSNDLIINLPKVTPQSTLPVHVSNLLSSINTRVNNIMAEHFKPRSNVKAVPWRVHFYRTGTSSSTLSNKWHYDFEVSRNCFFLIIYLNDAPGHGTLIYDYHTSKIISEEHGYISVPNAYRAKSLNFYKDLQGYVAPSMLTASTGKALLFSPSMCLHKGVIPLQELNEVVTTDRKILHMSFYLTDNKATIESCVDPTGGLLANLENIAMPPFEAQQ